MARIKLTRELDYIQGHLRSGYLELIVDENEWNNMSDDDNSDIEEELCWLRSCKSFWMPYKAISLLTFVKLFSMIKI